MKKHGRNSAGAASVRAPTKPEQAAASAAPQGGSEKTAPETICPEERYGMIAEAAYYRAKRRGFARGSEFDDWLAAEAEIERLLAGREETGRGPYFVQ